jgi:hypothetical protein
MSVSIVATLAWLCYLSRKCNNIQMLFQYNANLYPLSPHFSQFPLHWEGVVDYQKYLYTNLNPSSTNRVIRNGITDLY